MLSDKFGGQTYKPRSASTDYVPLVYITNLSLTERYAHAQKAFS